MSNWTVQPPALLIRLLFSSPMVLRTMKLHTLSPSVSYANTATIQHTPFINRQHPSASKRVVYAVAGPGLWSTFFIKISGNCFFTGKETKRKQDQKKKTRCVKRKKNSSRDNNKANHNRKTPQKYVLQQGWLWRCY